MKPPTSTEAAIILRTIHQQNDTIDQLVATIELLAKTVDDQSTLLCSIEHYQIKPLIALLKGANKTSWQNQRREKHSARPPATAPRTTDTPPAP